MMTASAATTFPPAGYRSTPTNTLLANALDLTAPASDALLRNRKNTWVQLAGHPGGFSPAGPSTVWKRQTDEVELKCYEELMKDCVRPVVPKLYTHVQFNGDLFIELEDLLQHFTDPCIMDIKMGSRTFRESEVSNQRLRPDLYNKMIKVDPNEPTREEHQNQAVTKLRYMQFRERESSSYSLGFRIDAMRKTGGDDSSTDLKRVRTREQVKSTLVEFVGDHLVIYQKFLTRLQRIRRLFEQSKYFKHAEVIGSSVLLFYDGDDKANIWMIDFANTSLTDQLITHRDDWVSGNREDGYLTGLDNLIQIMTEVFNSRISSTSQHSAQ